MLNKIRVADLRLGMHLHAPFWRSKFVLTDAADLQAVQGSGIAHCWIDSSKGLDLPKTGLDQAHDVPGIAETMSSVAPATDRSPVSLAPAPSIDPHAAPPEPVPAPSVSFEEELEHAARLCKKSRLAIQQLFGDLRLGKSLNTRALQPLVEELAASVFRNPGALLSLARLKTKDDYSYMHSVAVCALMIALSRELGLGATACREAGLAGLLHDVGKALMPLELLNKPGKLTDAEFEVMRSHPLRGHGVLAESGTAGQAALDVCLHHHERVDGSGYPGRLAGDDISQLARMGAICDVYDAITSTRPYKAAWDPADSISRMASWQGHFDPTLFAVFVRSLGIYPTGSLVRMRSGRLGVVVKQHAKDLTSPTVKLFFSTKSNLPIAVMILDLARQDANDAIVAREPRRNWNFPHIDALWAGEVASRR